MNYRDVRELWLAAARSDTGIVNAEGVAELADACMRLYERFEEMGKDDDLSRLAVLLQEWKDTASAAEETAEELSDQITELEAKIVTLEHALEAKEGNG